MCWHFLVAVVTSLIVLSPVQGKSVSNSLDVAMLIIKGTSSKEKQYCVSYVPAVKEISKETDAVFQPLVTLVNNSECAYENRGLEGKLVMVEHCSNDSNDEIVVKLKSAKASAAIILINSKRKTTATETTLKKVDITVAFIRNRTGYKIAKYDADSSGTLYAKLFARPAPFDWSFAAIWVLSVSSVVGGAYWSGVEQHSDYLQSHKLKTKKKPRAVSSIVDRATGAEALKAARININGLQDKGGFNADTFDETDGDFAVPISAKVVIMFVTHMCVMLLMLYYFFLHLVYVLMFMFAMASSAALVACLEPLASRINIGTSRLPKFLSFCCQAPLEVRDAVILGIGFSVGVSWLILRRHESAWILQDILGIAFCVNMLKAIRLPNLKMLCLLLGLLLIYDVFFVFITPLLSASRESVMVEVARGGNSPDKLPMVIMFPRLNRNRFEFCVPARFSILGLGDILAPGLLIAYCHAFDLVALGKRYYFYIACTGYGVGMVVTFCALSLMGSAQPALLYLVPCTILPTALVALCRDHLYSIWNGVPLSSVQRASTGRERTGERNRDDPNDPLLEGATPDAKVLQDIAVPGEEGAPVFGSGAEESARQAKPSAKPR